VQRSFSQRTAAIDLKYLGLIVSVGAAVAFRFFSDFSFSTIEHQAALAKLSIDRFTPATLLALCINSLSYELQRDWFNLSPQALPEVAAAIVMVALAYILLRRVLAAEVAAATVMFGTPFAGIGVIACACAWVLGRVAGHA
jgi:choline-glycine betaine transporter